MKNEKKIPLCNSEGRGISGKERRVKMESITIIITETDDDSLSVSCNIPEKLKNKISGALAECAMEFIGITMNKITGEEKTISRRAIN